ncbi:MAG: haloalkane dehalogenase [Woeseiaceae bacterium]
MLKIIGIVLLLIAVASVVAVFSLQASEQWTVAQVIRTPDDAFEDLPDYPFEPNYVDSLGYRIHYVDEGPRDGQVILLMHGQPSWSYLYRHMIPVLSNAGFRVIAPDNVGFGKSDKPLKPSDHTYQMHIDVMSQFIDELALENVTLFAQDWGGLIGLRVVADRPSQFSRIMLSNTALPAAPGIQGWLGYPLFRFSVWREGDVQALDTSSEHFNFQQWVAYARHTKNFDFEGLFQRATTRTLSDEDLAGYAAPFPTNEYIAAVRMFPTMVASQLRQNQHVMDEFYASWEKPFLTAFGTDDSLMAGRDKVWQTTVPGAEGQAHTLVENGNHFIQDDTPVELAELLIEFVNNN